MVGRHTSFLVTKRSLRNSDSGTGKRPRRVIQTKNVDDTVGLSRREEQELNKALYASLQENRRSKILPGFGDSISSFTSSGNNNISSSSSTTSIGRGSIKGHRCLQETSSTATTSTFSSSSSSGGSRVSKSQKVVQTLRHSLLSDRLSPKRLSRHRDLTASLSVDESSQDSVRSSASSHNGSKRKVHAQRKFAQGCSLPGMASSSPVKFITPAVKMLSSRVPKTEDFLTFLCLRGSTILPSNLDFFNFSLEEPPSCKEGGKPTSYADKTQREGTSDSSSTSSGANDEVAEAANVTTPTMTSRSGGGSLARRSAARASAGTPETARGIVSLRQGLQRKVPTSSTSSLARFPVSSSCLLPASRLTNNPPCQYRNKFYFTPEKSSSPSKTSGIRPGEFTPPHLFSSTSHMSSTYKFSPLVCSPSKFASIEQPFGSPASQSTSSRSSSLSSSSLCGASKRKRQLTVPPRAATTKVNCNSGPSIPSFRMAKCTRLDGLVRVSSLTPSSVSVASLPVASFASSLNPSTSLPIISSPRSSHNSLQTVNQTSPAVSPSTASLTPTSTIFKTNNCSLPVRRNRLNTPEFHSPKHQPIRTFSKFKHTGHKFPSWRNLKNSRTLLSTLKNYKFRSASHLKSSLKKASFTGSSFADPSFNSFPNPKIAESNHVPDTSACACTSNLDRCCNLHECSSSRTNPQSLHVRQVPGSDICMFGCQHVHGKSTVQPGMCSSYLCRLQCQNGLTRELTNSENSSCTNHSIMNTCSDEDSRSEQPDDSRSEQPNHSTSAGIVSDFHVDRTFPRGDSDFDVSKRCHNGDSDVDVNRRCHSGDSDFDVNRCRSSDSGFDVNRRCSGDSNFDVSRRCHSGDSDFDVNRSHSSDSDFDVNRSHSGDSDFDADKTFNNSVSDFDDNKVFHRGVSDFDDKRTFHRGISNLEANRTFHSDVFDIDRTFHGHILNFNGSVQKCRHDDSDGNENSIDCNDAAGTERHSEDDNKATNSSDSETENTGFSIVDNCTDTCNDSVSYVDAENTNNSSFLGLRRKAKKKDCKYHRKHKGRHTLNESRKRKVKRKYRLVKEVPKVKIRIVRRHSVNTCEVSSTLVERSGFQESTGESDKKPSGADFQREFLKMLQAGGGVPDSPDCSGSVENIKGFREKVTRPVNGARSLKDFGQRIWRNERDCIDGQDADVVRSLKDSNGFSESCPNSVREMNCINRAVSVKPIGYNRKTNISKPSEHLAEFHESSLSEHVKNHSECMDYQRNHSEHVEYQKHHRDHVGYKRNHVDHVGYRINHSEHGDCQKNHIECGNYQKNHIECGDYQKNHIECGDYQKNHSECGDYQKHRSDHGNDQKNHSEHGDYQKHRRDHVGYKRNHTECGDYPKNLSECGDYQKNHSECGNYQKNRSDHEDCQRNHSDHGHYQKNHSCHGDCQRNHSEQVDHLRSHSDHVGYQKNHGGKVDHLRSHSDHVGYQKNHGGKVDHLRSHSDHVGYQKSHSDHVVYQKNHSERVGYQKSQCGLVPNKTAHHEKLNTPDETLSMKTHTENLQLLSNSLQDGRSSVKAGTKNQEMSDTSTKSIKESTNLADSITLRDKVISAFAKFNRKDIIASNIEVTCASSGQPDPKLMLGSACSSASFDKFSDSEPIDRVVAADSPPRPSEDCADAVHKYDTVKLSKEGTINNPKEDYISKTDSGIKLLEDESNRRMLDESVVQDRELKRLACPTDNTMLELRDACLQTEADAEVDPGDTIQRSSLKGESHHPETSNALDLRKCPVVDTVKRSSLDGKSHHPEMQTSNALDLRKCAVQGLPFHLKVSSQQKSVADTGCNRSTQTEALDLSENGKDSVSTNHNLDVHTESGDSPSTSGEECFTKDVSCACLTKNLHCCNRQCAVNPNEKRQTQITTAEVGDKQIGTDISTCGKQQVVITETDAPYSGCKTSNHKSQDTSVSKHKISHLFKHKTAVYLAHSGKKQFKIKMMDVGNHPVKEYEIQQDSANRKCHIYKIRNELDENFISTKHSALKQPIGTGQQNLKPHLLSGRSVAQQKQSVSSCVSICIQPDHGCNELNEQNLASRDDNSELEVELGSNRRSVKVQVSNFLDASFCQGKCAGSDDKDNDKDSRAYDNVITLEMSDSPQNDKRIQDSTHSCCQNSMGIMSLRQSHTNGSGITSQPRGHGSESQDTTSASDTTNLLHKAKVSTNQDFVDRTINWSTDQRSSDNAENHRKIFLSETTPCCSTVAYNNHNCSFQTQKMISRTSENVLFAKQDTSGRCSTRDLLEQLDCYISGVTYLYDGVEKYDPEEATVQDKSDDVIMLSDDLKEDITHDTNVSLTNSSDSPVPNANSDLVIDLSIHKRSDSSSSSSSSSDSWSNCSSSSLDNCSITSRDNHIGSRCSIGMHVAEILDFAESSGNTVITSSEESGFESVSHNESTSTDLLDLRKGVAKSAEKGCISDTDFIWPVDNINGQANTPEKTKSNVSAVCNNFQLKPCSSTYNSLHQMLQNDRLNSARKTSQPAQIHVKERNKHLNLSAKFKLFQKHDSEYNSLHQRKMCSSQQLGRESTVEDNTFTSHQYSEQNFNKERTHTHEQHVESQKQGLQSSDCCRGLYGVQGEQLSSENSIILHSYGSLNTGQGFTVVNGQLKQCEILNKQHLQSNSTKCSSRSCKSSCRHPFAKELASTAVKRSTTLNKKITPRSACDSARKHNEGNDRPTKQQHNLVDRIEQLPKKMSLPYQIGNSSNKQGGVKCRRRDFSFCPLKNLSNDNSCCFGNNVHSSLSGRLEAAGNMECIDLSQQLEQVQISNCDNPCHNVSQDYMQALKKHVTRSDVTQFILRPKFKRKLTPGASRHQQSISHRKNLQPELSRPHTSNKNLASQKEKAASAQQHPKLTQTIKTKTAGAHSSVAQPSSSSSSWTTSSVADRDQQLVPKSCLSLCTLNKQTRNSTESASDRSILRSAYISDLVHMGTEVSPKSTYELPCSYSNNLCSSQSVTQISSNGPESTSKADWKTLGVPAKYDSSLKKCTLLSKSALTGAESRKDADASAPSISNGVAVSDGSVHTNILAGVNQSRSAVFSVNMGDTLQQSQHVTESQSSDASAIPATAAVSAATASSTVFPHNVDHSPMNLSRSGKVQDHFSSDWTLEIPCSVSPVSYLTNSQEENVLDVIMEELKIQIALLKEEIMRESQQQQSSESHTFKNRGRRNKSLSKGSLRPKGQRGFLLSQKRKSYSYDLQQLDHLFDFSNSSLDTAPGRSRGTFGPDLNDLNYGPSLPGGQAVMSGHGMSQHGNLNTGSGILMLNCAPELTRGVDNVTSDCRNVFRSQDKSTDTILRYENERFNFSSVKTVEAANTNVSLLAENEMKEYIEVSSDGEDLTLDCRF